jgi:hypothetical protein
MTCTSEMSRSPRADCVEAAIVLARRTGRRLSTRILVSGHGRILRRRTVPYRRRFYRCLMPFDPANIRFIIEDSFDCENWSDLMLSNAV